MQLWGGFSPVNALKQAGDAVNPFNGSTNYDVFGNLGDQKSLQQGGMSQGAYDGSLYYNPDTGHMEQYGNGQWNDLGGPGSNALGTSASGGASTYDPMAAARSSFVNSLGTAVGNIGTNAGTAFDTAGRTLRGQAESLFNTVRQGQKAIDRSRENVELNRLNGVEDILSFVRNGLKSGGSMLANKNAGESSATGEIARAYGNIGGSKMRNVGNQAFLQNREIDTQQEGLDLQRSQGLIDYNRTRDQLVSDIGMQTRQQLADLEDKALQLGVSGPQVDAEKERIINENMGKLNAIDQWLSGGSALGGVNAQGMDTTRKNAVALKQGGTIGTNPFDVGLGDIGGLTLQGPSLSQLPIYTQQKRKDQ